MISIVIAAYNCEPYLEQAIRSIQAQRYQDLEVLIVNDGSTDDTRQLAERLAQEDPRITVINQPNSGGPAQPRNLGIARSHGEYICFLDPDDYWYPDKLEKQLTLIESLPDVALVFSDMHRVDEHGTNLGPTYLGRVHYMDTAKDYLEPIAPNTYLTRPGFYAYSSVGVVGPVTSSIVLRRSALKGLEECFPLDLVVGEDIDLWFRILINRKAAFIDEPLHAYRQHSASLMHNSARVNIGLSATHTRNYARVESQLKPEQKKQYRRRIANHLFDLGCQQLLAGDKHSARQQFRQCFVWSPRPKFALAWCKTFLPRSSRN
jgi:glycosyltransferase involved in cell wall biosynthesis